MADESIFNNDGFGPGKSPKGGDSSGDGLAGVAVVLLIIGLCCLGVLFASGYVK